MVNKMNGNVVHEENQENEALPKVNNRRNKRNWYYVLSNVKSRIGLVLILGTLIGVALPLSMEKYYWKRLPGVRRDCQLPSNYRLECLPGRFQESQYTEEECKKLDCCWDIYEIPTEEYVPRCFHSMDSSFKYDVTEDISEECIKLQSGDSTDSSGTTYSSYKRRKVKAESDVRNNLPIGSEKPIMDLQAEVNYLSDDFLQVKILDLNGRAFEPYKFLKYNDGVANRVDGCTEDANRTYEVDLANTGRRLYLNIRRKDDTRRSIFNTDFGALIFSKQYLEFTAVIPSTDVYGLGEGNHMFLNHTFKERTTRTLFNSVPPISSWDDNDNETVIESWYGSQPFYICLEPDGKAHGVLFAHTSAMEITASGIPALTVRTNARWLTFYVFMGPTPKDVIRQLTYVVGKPVMPPFWAMGHHVCRTMNKTEDVYSRIANETKEFFERYIPHESDCVLDDVPLLPWSRDATDSYTNAVEDLRNRKIRITLVHSPLILSSESTQHADVLVKRGDGKPYTGLYRDSRVNYVDVFRNQPGYDWTRKQIENFQNGTVEFDGFILTANVPMDESIYEERCSKTSLNIPPFLPGASNNNSGPESVLKHTLCLDSCHQSTPCSASTSMTDANHYNILNLYGHGHAENVYHATVGTKRPFIISLSTFTGTGRYAGHWGGMVSASWGALKMAVVQMLEFNLYGIPLTGMPACGYTGKVNRDLCSRWAQLSAFQPLSITYRIIDDEELHPYLEDNLVGSVAAAALQIRYALLPYFYTVFHYSSITGDPVVRPLFYEWPTNQEARFIDEQFLWGSGLLISPVLHKATTTFKAYFPKGTWYDFYDGSVAYKGEGNWMEVSAIEYHTNIHIRGGHIIASQPSSRRTVDSRKGDFKVQVALEQNVEGEETVLARGDLYIDDGESLNGLAFTLHMEATATGVYFTPSEEASKFTNLNYQYSLKMDAVHILGVKRKYTKCLVFKENSAEAIPHDCYYNEMQGVLSFRNINYDIRQNCNLTWAL